jgi:hypothetical protein
MAEHGVDGAFLQRFASQCDLEAGSEGIRRIRDEVGDRVREAAEKEGRVFAIMWVISPFGVITRSFLPEPIGMMYQAWRQIAFRGFWNATGFISFGNRVCWIVPII